MKFAPCFLTAVLLLTACSRQEESRLSPDLQTRNKLAGTWVFEPIYTNGDRDHMITTTVAPDGSYVTTISLPHRKLGPRVVRQEGTWRVEDGFLIDVVTKDSQTDAPVPSTSRFRIIRINDRELQLDDEEKTPGIVYPTNKIVFRRQTE